MRLICSGFISRIIVREAGDLRRFPRHVDIKILCMLVLYKTRCTVRWLEGLKASERQRLRGVERVDLTVPDDTIPILVGMCPGVLYLTVDVESRRTIGLPRNSNLFTHVHSCDVWAMCGRCVGDVWAMCDLGDPEILPPGLVTLRAVLSRKWLPTWPG